ncbi:MAG: sulfatase [bacterium]
MLRIFKCECGPPRGRRPGKLSVHIATLALLLLVGCPQTGENNAGVAPSVGWMRAADGARPNVLLLTIDTFRHDHTGWTGRWKQSFTPNLDAFATEAARFSTATTPATATRPAIASLLTGLYPGTHSVRSNTTRLDGRYSLLPEALTSAGYDTAAFYGNSLIGPKGGFQKGVSVHQEFTGYLGSLDKKIADRGVEWLQERSGAGAPFFLWLHFMDPHGPYLSAPVAMRTSVPLHDELPRKELPVATGNYGNDIIPKYQKLAAGNGSALYRRRYRAEVAWTDRQIGRVLDELAAQGFADNTLVILTADHGESLGEHDAHFQHGWYVYEASANVPLALRLPGRIEGDRVFDENVSLVDLFPTLAAGLGLPDPPASEGRDLGPLLHGRDDANPPSFVISIHENNLIAVRDGRFKLVYTPRPAPGAKAPRDFDPAGWELFDLETDPGELRNAATQFPATYQRLQAQILDWQAAHTGASTPETAPVSRDLEDRLRQLGYVD